VRAIIASRPRRGVSSRKSHRVVDGRLDGLAYALFEPDGQRRGGVVIVHGADSCKENHFDYARAARAWGFAAIAFDQRGHGQTGGELDERAVSDIVAVASLLRPGPVALRGSSMGATLALAAAGPARAEAVVAICPAPAELLLVGLSAGRLGFQAAPGFRALLETLDLERSVATLSAPLLLMHAQGDEQVPVSSSEAIAGRSSQAKLIRVQDGDHRSVQHDPELQGESLRFVERAFARRAAPSDAG
jgi:pimeloyl-ACP methyl ester carboxylesterase